MVITIDSKRKVITMVSTRLSLVLFTMRKNRTWRNSGGRCVDQFSRVLGSSGNIEELRTQTSILGLRHPTTNHNNIETQTRRPCSLVVLWVSALSITRLSTCRRRSAAAGPRRKKSSKGTRRANLRTVARTQCWALNGEDTPRDCLWNKHNELLVQTDSL